MMGRLRQIKNRLLDELDSTIGALGVLIAYALSALVLGTPYIWLTDWRDGEVEPLFAILLAPVFAVLIEISATARRSRTHIAQSTARKIMWAIVGVAMVPIVGNFASIYLRMAGYERAATAAFRLRYFILIGGPGIFFLLALVIGTAVMITMASARGLKSLFRGAPPTPPSTPPGPSDNGTSKAECDENGQPRLDLHFAAS